MRVEIEAEAPKIEDAVVAVEEAKVVEDDPDKPVDASPVEEEIANLRELAKKLADENVGLKKQLTEKNKTMDELQTECHVAKSGRLAAERERDEAKKSIAFWMLQIGDCKWRYRFAIGAFLFCFLLVFGRPSSIHGTKTKGSGCSLRTMSSEPTPNVDRSKRSSPASPWPTRTWTPGMQNR